MSLLDSLAGIKSSFKSKDPDIIANPAQISYPPEPDFNYLEIPTDLLTSIRINFSMDNLLQTLRIISDKIKEAKDYLPFLYTYRSFNYIFSLEQDIKNYNQASPKSHIDMTKYFEKIQEFFIPKFQKLEKLYEFIKNLIPTLTAIFNSPINDSCDVIFTKLTELFSLVLNIEQLKINKTGINKDLSTFNRNPLTTVEMRKKIENIQMYLAQENMFLRSLREKIEESSNKAKRSEKTPSLKFITHYLKYCISAFNNQTLHSSSRTNFLIGMTCALYLHGNPNQQQGTNNIFTHSVCKDVFEILSNNPVIPLFGEAHFIPGQFISKCPGFIPVKQFPLAINNIDIQKHQSSYLLKYKLSQFRQMYRKYLPIASKLSNENSVTFDDLKGLVKCISIMMTAINNQSSYKFVIRAQNPSKQDIDDDFDDKPPYAYDLSVRFNYSNEDLDSLAETIGYIKTLASTIISGEPMIVSKIGKSIHSIVQEFLVDVIDEPMQRANEAKDDDAIQLLKSIHDCFGTSHDGIAPISRESLDLLRIQLQLLISPGSKFLEKVSLLTGSHFKNSHVKLIEKFLSDSADWYCLYDFVPNIRKETNLGSLWFHETMLDIDRVAQFPVRSSLPFILVKHLLSSFNKPALQDLVFFPFEIYNDAAWQSLNIFDSQYLFNEISAEMKLAVDMIAFTFADTFYKMTRETAAAMEMPYDQAGKIIPTPMRYSVMVQQNKMELLGAPIDFNIITTTKLNQRMRDELTQYVKMMSDIKNIPYVYHLFKVAETTHSLLCQNKIALDPFSTLWDYARGAETPLMVSSRMISNIDSLLDFSHMRLDYDELRYLFIKPIQITPLSTEKWADEYVKLHKKETLYVTRVHINALCRILNGNEMNICIKTIIKKFQEACSNALDCYNEFKTTIRLLPALSTHDLTGYYDFNMDAYSSVAHSYLGKFYATMRIIGNIILFVYLLDEELPTTNNTGMIFPSLINILKGEIIKRPDVFYNEEFLDIETVITHSNFSALWSVLEFIFCSPKTFYLSESNPAVLLMDTFGDGPIVAAHTLISLCNQQHRYEYTSICSHAIELQKMDDSPIEKKDLSKFLENAWKVDSIRQFTISITSLFKFPQGI